MRRGNGVGDGHSQLQAFPLRGVQVRRLGPGVTLRCLGIYAFTDPVEHRGRFAIHRRGTIISTLAASGRVCSQWPAQRRATCLTQDEVVRSFAHKSSLQLAHDYKLRTKERFLYQQCVRTAHSELKITIRVTRRLLTESLELLHKVDASLDLIRKSIAFTDSAAQRGLRKVDAQNSAGALLVFCAIANAYAFANTIATAFVLST
jgi:hypothetical protein